MTDIFRMDSVFSWDTNYENSYGSSSERTLQMIVYIAVACV